MYRDKTKNTIKQNRNHMRKRCLAINLKCISKLELGLLLIMLFDSEIFDGILMIFKCFIKLMSFTEKFI